MDTDVGIGLGQVAFELAAPAVHAPSTSRPECVDMLVILDASARLSRSTGRPEMTLGDDPVRMAHEPAVGDTAARHVREIRRQG